MKRILTSVSIILILVTCLAACKVNDTPPPDNKTTTTDTTTSAQPAETELSITDNGRTKYKLVRSEDSSELVTDAASKLRRTIMEKYNLSELLIGTDFEQRGADPSARYEYEILIGPTNRDESQSALASVGYNDFIICVSGKRVVIAGNNDQKTAAAVDYFIENCLSDSELSLPISLSLSVRDEYAAAGLTLLGRPLSDYRIVYKNSYKSEALALADILGAATGAVLGCGSESSAVEGPEIVIGSTKRGVSAKYDGTDSFSISVKDGNILIGGGSSYAIGSACRYLAGLASGTQKELDAAALNYSYSLPAREVYISDISKLAMHWDILFDTPEQMLNFSEKMSAMAAPDGRLMSCLHRGDMVYYPENSIEGIISAIRMGADMVEIDPRRTKDGVLVLMHDETLARTTNAADFVGKEGFPRTLRIYDWTYEQLCSLSLKQGMGGDAAALTPYKIPTLEEAIKVCAERIFVRLDKLDQWDYNSDIWPLIEKYKAYNTVIFTWHSQFTKSNYQLVKSAKQKMKQASGTSAPCFVGMNVNSSAASTLALIKANGLDSCVRFTDCDFSKTTPEDYLASARASLASLRGKARCYIDSHGNGSKYETVEYYKLLCESGINVLLVNKGLQLCRYIAQTEFQAN